MAKKEFINTKLVAEMTAEILLKLMEKNNGTIQQIADQLPQDYSYIWRKLKGDK